MSKNCEVCPLSILCEGMMDQTRDHARQLDTVVESAAVITATGHLEQQVAGSVLELGLFVMQSEIEDVQELSERDLHAIFMFFSTLKSSAQAACPERGLRERILGIGEVPAGECGTMLSTDAVLSLPETAALQRIEPFAFIPDSQTA